MLARSCGERVAPRQNRLAQLAAPTSTAPLMATVAATVLILVGLMGIAAGAFHCSFT